MDCFKILFVIVQLTVISKVSVCEGMSNRCNLLKTSEMKRICIGAYPAEVLYKYHDGVMEIGTIYAIFQLIDNSDNGYLISHYFSPLIKCVKAKLITPVQYNCTTKNDKTELVTVDKGFILCFNQNMQMLDDLLKLCTGKKMNPSEFVALQYSIDHLPMVGSNTDAVMFRMQFYFVVSTILFIVEKAKIVLLISNI